MPREFTSPRFSYVNLILALLAGAAVVFSAQGTHFSLGALFSQESGQAVGAFVTGLFPPDLSPGFLQTTLRLLVETIQISIMGTALAVALGAPLSLLAMRQRGEEASRHAQGPLAWGLRWGRYYVVRSLLNLLRSVPELIWALIFVVAVGLGPLPGVLALAAHSAGVLGKLYAEILEAVDQRLVEGVQATGAQTSQVLLFGLIPSALPVLLSYTLFRWECNMRAAAVLGFVGAGGIGTQIIFSLKLFQYAQLSTLILEVLLLVTLVDVVGQLLRSRILEGSSTKACG